MLFNFPELPPLCHHKAKRHAVSKHGMNPIIIIIMRRRAGGGVPPRAGASALPVSDPGCHCRDQGGSERGLTRMMISARPSPRAGPEAVTFTVTASME
jgi:hypothetical protein